MKNKYRIILIIYLVFIVLKTNAQNTTFNNVALGIDYPTYGAKIKANFPGYTGGWGRAYFITNETGDQSFFTFGSTGYSTNGVSSVTSNFIGKNLDVRYMTFLPNGNIGIATNNPQSKFQIGEYHSNEMSKISIPGVYNFEEMKLGQYGNGASGLEMVTHTNQISSFGVRLFASTDTGSNGLLIQTANPATFAQDLLYTTKLAVNLNGNVGIGTTSPAHKLDVIGTIRSREVKVDMVGADFVFEEKYPLMPLSELEAYVKKNKHLPEIVTAKEMQEQGANLGDLNTKLLQKIEELTLYVIEQQKLITQQANELESHKVMLAKIDQIEKTLAKMNTANEK